MNRIIKGIAMILVVSIMLGACAIFAATTYFYSFNAGCDNAKTSTTVGSVYYKNKAAKLKKGCFLQYIYAGPDMAISPPSSSGGVTGDDVLLITGEVGQDFLGVATLEGEFYYTHNSSEEDNATPRIYVRAWSTFESNILSGSYYGNSIIFTPEVSTSFIPSPNDTGLPTFETGTYFDVVPPGPPINFKATQEASGDLILSWTPTSDADVITTMIRWKLGSYPTDQNDGTLLTEVATNAAAQSFRHGPLTDGTVYFYAAFSKDLSLNFSTSAKTSEASHDTLPPSVVMVTPINPTRPPVSTVVDMYFDDTMAQGATVSSFHILPSVPGSFTWPAGDHMRFTPNSDLSSNTTYLCTIDTNAQDDAGNNMSPPNYTWFFKTGVGQPPFINDGTGNHGFKIDGWKRFPGDIISGQPRITANIGDPESSPPASGITTIEIRVNGTVYNITSPEISGVFDSITGDFDFRLPVSLYRGTYTVTLEAWDISGNSTVETAVGLEVRSGAAKLEQSLGSTAEVFVLAFPNPIPYGSGAKFAYTLSVNADIVIYLYSGISGKIVYKRKIPSGIPGGMAGYNEFDWNGLNNFNETVPRGIYILKITAGSKTIGSSIVKVI